MKDATSVTVYLVKDKISGMYVGSYCIKITEHYYLSDILNDLLSEGIILSLSTANIYIKEALDYFSEDGVLVDLELIETELSIGIPIEVRV